MGIVNIVCRKTLEGIYYSAMPSYGKEKKNLYQDLPVKFPKLEKVFLPHVMYPTEVDKSRNRTGTHYVFLFFKTMIQTIEQYPDFFAGISPLDMFWSEKNLPFETQSRRLIVEHGWLPRNSYQIAATGANGRGAPAKLDSGESYLHIIGGEEVLIGKLKLLETAYYSTNPQVPDFIADKNFIVVPMQLGNDLNLRDSTTKFSTHYGKENATDRFVVDFVKTVNELDLPYPVYFTQHPVDKEERNITLRKGDRFIRSGSGLSTLDLIRQPGCLGIISVNSNVVHEALCLDVPCCVLGRLFWREDQESPFDKDPVHFFSRIPVRPHTNPIVMEYLAKLLCYQWYLSDLQNPLILREIILYLGEVVPLQVRKRLSAV